MHSLAIAKNNLESIARECKSLANAVRTRSFVQFIARSVESLHSNDLRNFFKMSRFLSGSNKTLSSHASGPIRGQDGTLYVQAPDVLAEFARHFESVAQDASGHSRDPSHWATALSLPIAQDAPTDPALSAPISLLELQFALSKLKKGKAAGPGCPPPEYFLCASVDDNGVPSPLFQILHRLISLIFSSSSVPVSLSSAFLVPIFKKGDPLECINYRPISIIDGSIKLLCSILGSRLSSFLESQSLLRREQAGFRRHEECAGHVVSLYDICHRRSSRGFTSILAFLDISKAFDTVPHEALFRKLASVGVGGVFLGFLRSLYSSSSFSVKLGNMGSSAPQPLCRGVRQGCPLSPFLFNIFINDIFNNLPAVLIPSDASSPALTCSGLLFADDTVIIAESLTSLQISLNFLSTWANVNEMQFNNSKSGVFFVSLSPFDNANSSLKTVCSSHPLLLQGSPVPVVDSYVYLGIYLTPTLSLGAMIKDRCAQAKKVLNVWRPVLSASSIPARAKVLLVKSFIIPVLCYGSELFSIRSSVRSSELFNIRSALHRLQSILNDCARYIAHSSLKPLCSPAALLHEFDLPPISALAAAARTRLF